MYKLAGYFILALSILSFTSGSAFPALAQDHLLAKCDERSADRQAAIATTRGMVDEVVLASFPALKEYNIDLETFRSYETYFKSRFSISRYLTFRRLKIVMSVNPCIYQLGAPRDGLRAIIAHELAHADYYRRKNFFGKMGLVRLVDDGFAAKFERRTDLVAIGLGYGEGLIEYREWLYKNVPEKNLASKKRDYFSPEEIALLIPLLENKPAAVQKLLKRVPLNLSEVEKAVAQ